LTIATPTVNSTITDGTVVWTINKDLSLLGGTINGDLTVVGEINGINFSKNEMSVGDSFNIYNEKDTANINIFGGTKTVPATSARLALYGGSLSNGNAGKFVLESATANDSVKLVGDQNGNLVWGSNDLAGSAIVAKSLSANGYIKYASGLIIQWGRGQSVAQGTPISFPTSFTTTSSYYVNINSIGNGKKPSVYSYDKNGNNAFKVYGRYFNDTSSTTVVATYDVDDFTWIAIGY
jgi:hypothetical protein